MLECEDGTIYTGVTDSPITRIGNHFSGKGARYTKKHRPIKILSLVEMNSKSDAMFLERLLKRCGKQRKYDFANRTLTYTIKHIDEYKLLKITKVVVDGKK
jgi:putative endonuclease